MQAHNIKAKYLNLVPELVDILDRSIYMTFLQFQNIDTGYFLLEGLLLLGDPILEISQACTVVAIVGLFVDLLCLEDGEDPVDLLGFLRYLRLKIVGKIIAAVFNMSDVIVIEILILTGKVE